MDPNASEMASQPIVNFVGDKVALGPLRRDLVPLYVKWVNDFEVTRTLGIGFHPMTLEAEEEWYARTSKDERRAFFTIYERSTMRPIGNVELGNIDHLNRTSDFGIMIGERDCWGKGYGTEAARLTLDYGFSALSLHNVVLTGYSFNERAIGIYLRVGFREIGRRREAVRRGGRAYDVVYMDCLASEFEGAVLGRVLVPPGAS